MTEHCVSVYFVVSRVFVIWILLTLTHGENSFDDVNSVKFSSVNNITSDTRFLIYDVKDGEGFNLRRAVYIRAATLVKHMIDRGEDWILVLPPWRHLFHWKSRYLHQNALPWNHFFDLNNMNNYVPVMEFQDYMKLEGYHGIDHLLYLQWHPNGFSSSYGWNDVIEIAECRQDTYYKQDKEGLYRGYFWDMQNVYARKHNCVSVGGHAIVLADFLKQLISKSFLVLHFEQVIATGYGGVEYFKARRSLVFAKDLRSEGDMFRFVYLNSTDEEDKTTYNDDWRKQIPVDGSAIGGPFLGLHMRRGDFTYAHRNTVPSLEEIGLEVKKKLQEYKIEKVYISTDGTDNEVQELQTYFKAEIHRFPQTHDLIEKYKDGGIAIIDQWIVSHARYFIGTCTSTFSFRIHEERDILGFNEDTTYNCICGKQSPVDTCKQPTRWRVKF